jgi:hypothetical protein
MSGGGASGGGASEKSASAAATTATAAGAVATSVGEWHLGSESRDRARPRGGGRGPRCPTASNPTESPLRGWHDVRPDYGSRSGTVPGRMGAGRRGYARRGGRSSGGVYLLRCRRSAPPAVRSPRDAPPRGSVCRRSMDEPSEKRTKKPARSSVIGRREPYSLQTLPCSRQSRVAGAPLTRARDPVRRAEGRSKGHESPPGDTIPVVERRTERGRMPSAEE